MSVTISQKVRKIGSKGKRVINNLQTEKHRPESENSLNVMNLQIISPSPETKEDFDAQIYIHPSADVSPEARIGAGSRIWQHVQIRERVTLGEQCIVGKGVYIDPDVMIGHCVKIQNYVSIFQGVMIESGVFIGPHVTFTNDRYPRAINPNGRLKGPGDWNLECTLVGYGASIGAGAIILPGVRIGAYAMIGAGAVVTGDVPDHRLVIGNPAQLRGYVCRCGRTLELNRQSATWVCPDCQGTYIF